VAKHAVHQPQVPMLLFGKQLADELNQFYAEDE